MRSTYAWCESSAQVRALLRRGRPSIDVFVAVWPDAAWQLRQSGIAYVTPDRFCSDAVDQDRAEAILQDQVRWAAAVDRWLAGRIPQFQATGFTPATWDLYHLKIFLDELVLRSGIVTDFVHAARPARVVSFAAPEPHLLKSHLGFYESLDALLWPAIARVCDAELTQIRAIRGDRFSSWEGYPPGRTPRQLAGALLARLPSRWQARIRHVVSATPLNDSSDNDVANADLLIGEGYDLGTIAAEARRRGSRVATWSDALRRMPVTKDVAASIDPRVWRELTAEPWFWSPMNQSGIDLRSVAEPRLAVWWRSRLEEVWPTYVSALEHFGRHPVRLGVGLPPLLPADQALYAAARRCGSSIAVVQHGGFVGVCEHIGWDILDLAWGYCSFTYGDGVTRYFAGRRLRSQHRLAEPISIGSSRLDTVAVGISKDERRAIRRRLNVPDTEPLIVFVPTAMMGYARQLCLDSYVDMPYYELQLRVFELFGAHPRVAFAYKPFVNCIRSPLRTAFRWLCPTGRWVLSPRLTTLMWAADAIVIDFPSTALLEAVLTRAPILVLADRAAVRLTTEGRDTLRRRATVAETQDEFLTALADLLRASHRLGPAPVDRQFEKAFARHIGDGRSASRALDALLARAGAAEHLSAAEGDARMVSAQPSETRAH